MRKPAYPAQGLNTVRVARPTMQATMRAPLPRRLGRADLAYYGTLYETEKQPTCANKRTNKGTTRNKRKPTRNNKKPTRNKKDPTRNKREPTRNKREPTRN
jgi:hypothetical protein